MPREERARGNARRGGNKEASESTRTTAGRLDALEEELRALFFDIVEERIAEAGVGKQPDETVLQLRLKLSRLPRVGASGQSLADQVREAAARCAESTAAFPPGRVYCYWCRSFRCGHSYPQGPRCVFGGYSPTGQPLWVEFASALLARRDPRIEVLYRSDPEPLTLVVEGRELASEQLTVYGKGSRIYSVLGQVAIGYLKTHSANDGGSPLAVTVQAVESRQIDATGRSHWAVALNVLGCLDDGTPAHQVVEESYDSRLVDALQSTKLRLGEISLARGPRRHARRDRRRKVMDALRKLSRNLDRIFRQGRRRTRHSRKRHSNRERPASTALGDALRARVEAIFRDVEERTWIVLGPKNRVHVFNDDGRHVTSVVYSGETVRYRTTRGKWRTPRTEDTRRFRSALQRQADKDAPEA